MEISKLKELREKMLHEKSGFDFEDYRIVTDTYKGIVAAFGVYLYSKEDARDAIIKCATSDYSKQELMAILPAIYWLSPSILLPRMKKQIR